MAANSCCRSYGRLSLEYVFMRLHTFHSFILHYTCPCLARPLYFDIWRCSEGPTFKILPTDGVNKKIRQEICIKIRELVILKTNLLHTVCQSGRNGQRKGARFVEAVVLSETKKVCS